MKCITLCSILLLFLGCEAFLEADSPNDQIDQSDVFQDEAYATAAVTNLYSALRDGVLLTGKTNGLSVLFGLYADELDYYSSSGSAFEAFYNHQIMASNTNVKSIWDASYNLIFMCNSALEGLDSSQNLSPSVKNQLKGEALFVRTLVHFYLNNLFGEIPYITSTDYVQNQKVSKTELEKINQMAIQDLIEAKAFLNDTYPSTERIRANRSVVSALLARVYLYNEKWQEAELESSYIIDNTAIYNLGPSLNEVFLKSSKTTILQLKPKKAGDNTDEAVSFLFSSAPPPFIALNPDLVSSFLDNDSRKRDWIKEVTDGDQIWYAPFKYKQNQNTKASQEYSVVMRLSEQYLIRAEARTHLGNLIGAKQDLNMIRNRAGLEDTTASNSSDLIEAILTERKFEFFAEHGHRWFDLKRLNKAEEVLGPVKNNWKITHILMPIPETELLLNPNLAPQNAGY
ncbi:RagB/SusD family nutrient uptake outer membrane protein [Gelidibacter salicanalis]|uniref:RagB/SusD family nutrient uptake outer membrane protein n=2 Tax=Gelidibacter salicanalis TaxID=291193 RepID=A0A934NKE4_9FLAO|nr:RagB/SusD family nutrient uptake outer membrane protein [Gelidibacter salicanalis]